MLSCFSSEAVKVTCEHGKDDFPFKNPPSKVGSPFLVHDVTSREKSSPYSCRLSAHTARYQRLTNLHRSVIHRAQETRTFHCLHHQLSPQRLFCGHGPSLPDPNLLLTFLGFRRAICASLGSQLTCHIQGSVSLILLPLRPD